MNGSERSVLAEIALQFIPKRELVATAGLGHLLRRSAAARETLEHLVTSGGATVPGGLQYRNEQYDETSDGRPDIVGSVAGSAHLIVEGKFWADLTDAQPGEYLKRLAQDGCLLFVAPAKRQDLLWDKLLRRCEEAGLQRREERQSPKANFAGIGDSWWMGIVSWTTLLRDIRDALEVGGEGLLRSDVDQLLSLCHLEDEEAFLPLTPADLARPTPLRVLQFMNLVEKVSQKGHEPSFGLFKPKGLHAGAGLGFYGRFVSDGRLQLRIFVDLGRWSNHGLNPLWFELAIEPGEALKELEAGTPPRVTYDGFAGRPVVRLALPLHAEESDVVTEVLRQIADILERVKDCQPTVKLASAEDVVQLEDDPLDPEQLVDDDQTVLGATDDHR